jgi:uncharacterized protein
MYLDELARGGPLRELLGRNVLDHLGTLFEEPPYVLQQELRRPAIYFSILDEIASGPRPCVTSPTPSTRRARR